MEATLKSEKPIESAAKRQEAIQNHLEIAARLSEAAELHLEVANHLENNYYERAFQTAINAYGFISLVKESQKKTLNDMNY